MRIAEKEGDLSIFDKDILNFFFEDIVFSRVCDFIFYLFIFYLFIFFFFLSVTTITLERLNQSEPNFHTRI